MYGPITTLRHDNCLVKQIPWLAFKMVDLDWTRVVDAHDILEVSKVFICFAERANKEDTGRTQIEFSNTSPMKRSQPSGMHSPHLRSFKHRGRRNRIAENMPFTRMCLLMVSKRSESTTPALTRSRALSWHLVSPRL